MLTMCPPNTQCVHASTHRCTHAHTHRNVCIRTVRCWKDQWQYHKSTPCSTVLEKLIVSWLIKDILGPPAEPNHSLLCSKSPQLVHTPSQTELLNTFPTFFLNIRFNITVLPQTVLPKLGHTNSTDITTNFKVK